MITTPITHSALISAAAISRRHADIDARPALPPPPAGLRVIAGDHLIHASLHFINTAPAG